MKLFVNLFLVRLYTRINIFKISFDFIEKRFGVVLKELLKFLSDMSPYFRDFCKCAKDSRSYSGS